MESDNKIKNRRNDIVMIIALLAVAVVFLLVQQVVSKDGARVIVTQNGSVQCVLSLDDTLQGDAGLLLESEEGYNLLEIKEGKASIIEADCPDGLCVKQKAISKQGESLICLPHKLVITVEGEEENGIDAFAY